METETLNFDKALVTGAGGWLGKGLIHSLKEGWFGKDKSLEPPSNLKIRALDREFEKSGSFFDSVECIQADLRTESYLPEFFKDAEDAVLFHLAGIIHPKKTSDFDEINFKATKRLVLKAKEAGIRRVVIMSSNSPCGTNPHRDHRFDEESPYKPYMGYGSSKMKMEQSVREICESSSLEYTIVRAPWFYGPFQPARQTLFFSMIKDGKGPIVGDGSNMRSMAFIDNLVQGLLLAAIRPEAKNNTYWIADERPYSMTEIISTVEDVLRDDFNMNVKGGRMKLPGIASEVALAIDWTLQKLGLYHQKIHVLSEMNKNIACSVDKARKDLGYEPQVALRDGMRKSIQWCLENGQKV